MRVNRDKYMFDKAIVRTPPKSLVDGITTAGLGKPDYELIWANRITS